jgi:hypothetical protein
MEGMLFNLASGRRPAGMGQPNSEGRGAAVFHERTPGDNMAEPSGSNSLELRVAFHNAVSRFQDWTADVAEPKVRLRSRFCPIREVCQEVTNLSDQLPEAILSALYKESKAGEDMLALKMDETYRGAGRHLLRLIERRKDEIRRRKELKS